LASLLSSCFKATMVLRVLNNINVNINDGDLSQFVFDGLGAVDQLLWHVQSDPQLWRSLLLHVFGRSEQVDWSGLSLLIKNASDTNVQSANYVPKTVDTTDQIVLNDNWLKSIGQDEFQASLLDNLGYALGRRLNRNIDSTPVDVSKFSSLIRSLLPPTATGSVTLTPVPEDSSTVGESIENLFVPVFSDADNHQLLGIVVTGSSAGNSQGEWQFRNDSTTYDNQTGVWRNVDDALNCSFECDPVSLFLSLDTRIRFLPEKNFNGQVSHFLYDLSIVAFFFQLLSRNLS